MGVLHLLALFSACVQDASFLSLIIERGRESCGTTALMSLTTIGGETPLQYFAFNCSDLSLTKMVLREHPPSLTVLTNNGRTPLRCAEFGHGSTSDVAVFFRATSAAFNTSNLVALQALCGNSSPYLARELGRQTTALRSAVAISLKRPEAVPSALISRESGVALAILGRVRAADGAGHLLRCIFDFVGPYADPFDPGWMMKELMEGRRGGSWRRGRVAEELAAANKEQAATIKEQAAAIRELATTNKELVAVNKELVATISKLAK